MNKRNSTPTTTTHSSLPERWLSKRELAGHLNFSTRWIEKQHRKGLPSAMMGGQRRYRISDVETWLLEGSAA